MIKLNVLRAAATVISIAFASASYAGPGHHHGGSAVGEMCNMMIGLQHYPTDAEKTRLKEIAADAGASEQEKTIAMALMNMSHSVSAADKAKLKQITEDGSAPANVRELAGILMNMSHMPSEGDKAKLKELAQ